MPQDQQHWEVVYGAKAPDQVSWFRPHLETSLALIERATQGNRSASIVEVGGGACTLVDDLIERRYGNLTIADISQTALDVARDRLGRAAADRVHWLRGDVTQPGFLTRSFDVWHDRAVFHFLATPEERLAYVRNASLAVNPGGHVIVSTFGPEGPAKCSGLPVARYDAGSLHGEFGSRLAGDDLLFQHAHSGQLSKGDGQQRGLACHFLAEQSIAGKHRV